MLSPILHLKMAEQLATEALEAASVMGAPFEPRAYALVQLAAFHKDYAEVLLIHGVPMHGTD
jgi:hypothetical protein